MDTQKCMTFGLIDSLKKVNKQETQNTEMCKEIINNNQF